ncbi:hypothetical protein PMZ80_001217 [Knufia obscura]|uniref:Uncharacterized protein n=2 Tax=Knufia TaxID=430999 RepID=A0AAN8FHE1_9EURO|nr:hypothetical protein PMZ80_001217 [Knufia obscura]KAK5958721.1 hypothetical protein OHC33_000564 [Knufia fluminis]
MSLEDPASSFSSPSAGEDGGDVQGTSTNKQDETATSTQNEETAAAATVTVTTNTSNPAPPITTPTPAPELTNNHTNHTATPSKSFAITDTFTDELISHLDALERDIAFTDEEFNSTEAMQSLLDNFSELKEADEVGFERLRGEVLSSEDTLDECEGGGCGAVEEWIDAEPEYEIKARRKQLWEVVKDVLWWNDGEGGCRYGMGELIGDLVEMADEMTLEEAVVRGRELREGEKQDEESDAGDAEKDEGEELEGESEEE